MSLVCTDLPVVQLLWQSKCWLLALQQHDTLTIWQVKCTTPTAAQQTFSHIPTAAKLQQQCHMICCLSRPSPVDDLLLVTKAQRCQQLLEKVAGNILIHLVFVKVI